MKKSDPLHEIIKVTSSIVLDKSEQVQNVIICLLAHGHLLIEDQPGVGKTTLAQCISKLTGLKSQRIQFTHDLLPADILGYTIFNSETKNFAFKEGPIFTELLLADELNRAHPKTQSALLQAMEENQVTIDRTTYTLPSTFFLIATQNPRSQIGTHSLPESQVDRFMMSLHLDYISSESEIKLFLGESPRSLLSQLQPLINQFDLNSFRELIKNVHIDLKIARFISELLAYTRQNSQKFTPLSTRAGLALVEACKARAFLFDRTYIIPEDVTRLAKPVLSHRLSNQEGLIYGESLVDEILNEVSEPI